LPFGLEAAPLASQVRAEQGDSVSDVLAGTGKVACCVDAPILGVVRDDSHGQVNGLAKGRGSLLESFGGKPPTGPEMIEPLSNAADDKKRQKSSSPPFGVGEVGKPEDHVWFWLLGGFVVIVLPGLFTPERKGKTPNV
jgi:hypothetical protein